MKFQKKTTPRCALKILLLLVLMLNFSAVNFSQTLESDTATEVTLPDAVMKQVVRKVLTLHFKSKKQDEIVYLSDSIYPFFSGWMHPPKSRIQPSWLPKMEGAEFQLISRNNDYCKQYFFSGPREISKGKYKIHFGNGCWSSGFKIDVWDFSVLKKVIKLQKKSDESFGMSGMDSGPKEEEPPPPPVKKKLNQ
jgi:hypothetical protein